MMDLNEMVMSSLTKMQSEGKVQEIVEKHVESTVESIVKDLFGSWSDFSKGLKEEAQNSLAVNFKELNLPSYNHMILETIKEKLNNSIQAAGVESIASEIEGLLSNPKREYKLSELVKELAKEIEDADELEYEEYREMTLHIDDERPTSAKFIYMDAKEDVSEYQCKYRLFLSREGVLLSVEVEDKESWKEKSYSDFDAKTVMSGLSGLEETLFKIYTSGAKIVIDEAACETTVGNPEYE